MTHERLRITYIGGPITLLEIGGVGLLTGLTFDPAESEYPATVYTLRKVWWVWGSTSASTYN